MPDETRPKASRAAAAEQAPEAENPVEEVRYERDQLVTSSRALLRTKPMFVAGALAAAPNRKTFTLAEAEEMVRDYLKVEVEPTAGAPS